MFRVSGTVRKGSKTVIYRHHFLFRCSLYVKYLAFKFQLPPLIAGAPLPKCEVCDTAKLCPAPAWSLLGWGVQPAVRHPAYLCIYGAAHLHIYIILHMKIMEP